MSLKERDFYEQIKFNLEKLFKEKADNIYFELTADKSFSDVLKSAIPKGHDIIFNFLKTKEARPDITGFIKTRFGYEFIVAELKTTTLKLNDIYQLRKYADLLNARFGFLISLHPIPEEIKRLTSKVSQILHSGNWRQRIIIAYFNPKSDNLVGWYPHNPFEEDFLWQEFKEEKSDF